MKKSLRISAVSGIAGVLIAGMLAPLAAYATPSITESSTISGASPSYITAGPDGNIWFTESGTSKIGKYTFSGAPTEYALTAGSAPQGITAGPDGNLWFTEGGASKIGKITPQGTITEYVLTANSLPMRITAGPDGNLWFTENNANKIGSITTSGTVTEYPTAVIGPYGITAGPDNNIWFTENSANGKIGVMSVAGAVLHEYATPTANSDARGITAGSDGNLWFVENPASPSVAKITTSGTITEYATAGTGALTDIAADSSGNLWYTDAAGPKIGKINTAGAITEYATPTSGSQPTGIAVDAHNNVWFTELAANKIGQLTPVPSTTNGDGTTTATIAAGDDESGLNYTVPDKQTLTVDGKLGNVIVKSGGTLKGHGTVGNLIVQSGGHLDPGNSPGCINTGNLTLAGTLDEEIGGTTACSGYDQTQVTGTVDLTGSTLNASLYSGFVPAVGNAFTIITNDGSDAVTGTFTGLAEGATFTSQGVTYSVTYKGGDGNDVVLTVTGVDASSLPTKPNTGLRLVAANPVVDFGLSVMAAGALIYASQRLKPSTKR